jgi:hypothetical protein
MVGAPLGGVTKKVKEKEVDKLSEDYETSESLEVEVTTYVYFTIWFQINSKNIK